MFYNETKAIKACEDDPSLIFQIIKEGHYNLVDKILSKKKVNINILDDNNCDVVTRLLRAKQFKLVLKFMKKREWNINNQDNEGNCFAHYLVTIDYKYIVDIIKQLIRNKSFIPNLKNNNNETILDKAINNNYIYTTIKILEDNRFNNIDIASFKHLYDTYINNNSYGKYTRITNLKIIINSLDDKELKPRMNKLLDMIKNNMEIIKEEILGEGSIQLNNMIDNVLEEINA